MSALCVPQGPQDKGLRVAVELLSLSLREIYGQDSLDRQSGAGAGPHHPSLSAA